MKHIAKLWENMLAKRALSMALCLALAVTSGGVCIASTNNLVQETRAAGGEESQPESEAETEAVREEAGTSPESVEMEGEVLEDDTKAEEPEDTRCIHEFTAAWVGYECKLTDFVDGYEPGDEVRISVSFNKAVTSQIGLYIDGVWNSFRGEGKKRNITLVPDSDYLNIQISDLKGQASVNLTEISAEIVRKGEADTGSYLHKFTGLWQGFETKFSDFNPDYEPGDEVRVTVNYSKYVSSQLGMNIGGEWSTLTGDGKELIKDMTPDNDYLNIQITDMWANYKVGIISISVDILKKGPGVSGFGGGGGRLAATQYKEPGDYVLFSGEANGKYETNDGWILDCADTDWITLRYSCAPEHENWGVLGWGATVDGEWVDGPGYSADSSDSTREVTQTFSVKYLRKMMKITPESNVSYLNLGSYSDGQIEELTLHVGSEIPRERSLFKDGAPNQAWNCTDIERILDAPDEKYLCVQYRCAVSDFNGWTILNWGASVNGEWRNGKSYKASYKEATRDKFTSMRMDSFRNMLHLSWDVKVDSIQLAAYNDAQILDIWISDDKVEDPGEEKKEREVREGSYHSSNTGAYNQILRQPGAEYVQNLTLKGWEWGDLKGAQQIIRSLKKNTYLIVEFEAEEGEEPNLQFSMADGKQQGVTPVYISGNQALFSYEDIQDFLPSYLIPQEVSNLQISAGESGMTIKSVKVIAYETELDEDPIGVLTSSWSGFGTQISKWHSDYEPGKDTVKVTVTFDKPAPGSIAFNMGGAWNNGSSMNSTTITRTAKPDDDYLGIQLGEMPKGKSYVLIKDIKVEIVGKINFNELVEVEGSRSAGMLASTKKEAATAVLSDEEIKKGTKVIFELKNSSLSAKEQAEVKALFGSQADKISTGKAVDINVYKEDDGKRTQITQTDDPVKFKMSVPDELQGKGYDFAVVENHGRERIKLKDLDSNPSTITFAVSKFSKFVIVYGEEGSFDERVHTFYTTGDWEFELKKYYPDYNPKEEVTIKAVLSSDGWFNGSFKGNAVDGWVQKDFESNGENRVEVEWTGCPSGETMLLNVGWISGKIVKVDRLTVEKKAEEPSIHTYTAAGDWEFKLSDYCAGYKPKDNVEIKATLSSDGWFNGSLKGDAVEGWAQKNFESNSENQVEVEWAGCPSGETMLLNVGWISGKTVKVDNLTVVKKSAEQIIHEFTAEEDWEFTLSDYCSDYKPEDEVVIKATLSSDAWFNGSFKGNAVGGWTQEDFESDGENRVEVEWIGRPSGGTMLLRVGWLNGKKVNVDQLTVTKKSAGQIIHSFTQTGSYELTLKKYCPDYEERDTVLVTVDLSSDQGFGGILEGNVHKAADPGYEWAKANQGNKFEASMNQGKYRSTFTWTVRPSGSSINVSIWNMDSGSTGVDINKISVVKVATPCDIPNQKNAEDGYDSYPLDLKEYLSSIEIGKTEINVTVELTSNSYFNGVLGGNAVDDSSEDGYSWKQSDSFEAASSGGVYKAAATWTGVPSGDSVNVNIWWMNKDSQGVNVERVAVTAIKSFDGIIQSEDYVYMFTEPETIILELADYYDEYEEGQGVAVELNLFSNGNFYAMVEDADYVTAVISDQASKDDKAEEGLLTATASNAEPAVATASNAMPAETKTKTKTKTRTKAEAAKATPSNATPAEATPSNATPAEATAVSGDSSTRTSKAVAYESDEDGILTVVWFGNPQSGSIAVTILDMDGTQVNIDTIDVEEKAGAVSVKAVAASAANDMASENSKEKGDFAEPEPAKKEEELTGCPDDVKKEEEEWEEPEKETDEEPDKEEMWPELDDAYVNEADEPDPDLEERLLS